VRHRSAETVPTGCISRNLEGRVCKSLWTIKLTDTGTRPDHAPGEWKAITQVTLSGP